MKVVLFCGGLGMRMRSDAQTGPKPMMPIGDRPVLWHLMRYYAHYGHTEFVLCLGYGARAVKEYFLHYEEATTNDFVLSEGGSRVDLLASDISDWKITFVNTGINVPIGERLRRVREYLGEDEYFLANYGDVLTDANINDVIAHVKERQAIASMLAIRPLGTSHVVHFDPENGSVESFESIADLPIWINGGFFVLHKEIFEYLNEGEDLLTDVCGRAAEGGRVLAVPYEGFWAPMDTLKERAMLEELYQSGDSPWMPWMTDRELQVPVTGVAP